MRKQVLKVGFIFWCEKQWVPLFSQESAGKTPRPSMSSSVCAL